MMGFRAAACRCVVVALSWLACGAAEAQDVRSAVLRVDYAALLPLSRLDLPAEDLGFAGGELATGDNQTTGAFLGQNYAIDVVATTPDEAVTAFGALIDEGIRIVVVLAESAELLAMADAAPADALILNARSGDAALRDGECRGNVLHIAPSDLMRSDAVAQFLIWKQWDEWLLIHGSNPADRALGEAYQRSATKFGAEVVETRVFEDTGGSRVSDSGHVLVQRQMPVFTQGAERHDVVVAADATDYFAAYLPYNTWDARPVAGSSGLRPLSWHPTHEGWGATQLQRRFEAMAGRPMRDEDYQTWLALRVVGEAVTRTGSADATAIRDHALSDEFALAAFKGQPVTFRDWNGQLRQPILLSDGRMTVSVSPQEGFLHQVSPLDTLGLDRPESACTAFEGGN